MKNLINNAILFGLMIVLTTSCNDEFLSKNNPGALTLDKLYHTKADFSAALGGCYGSIMGPATYNIYLGDITGDNVFITSYQPSGAMVDIDKLVVSALNGDLNTFWSNNYMTIERVNMLLDKLVASTLSDNDKKLFAAEAKFLRAFSYFSLVRVFGGVPLYDKQIDLAKIYDVPRASIDDVFKLVISDLTESKNIDSYRTSADLAIAGGKASSVAAKTLLGKVYIWKKDFANAETTLADVVTTSGKQLETLSVLYDPDQPFNKEIIFSINYDRVGNFSSPFVTASIPYNSPIGIYPNVTTKGGSGVFMIEPAFLSKFSPDDKRASQLIATMAFSNLGIFDTWNYSTKYLDLKTTFNYWSGANTIILRYADVLLMYAEALNENGKTAQAYTYINQVRTRAGIPNMTAGFTKAQMFQALADERAKEFLLEGDRWFDMVFRGLPFIKQEMTNYFPNSYLVQNRILTVKDNCLLFPIPDTQIQVKPVLTQNPGY